MKSGDRIEVTGKVGRGQRGRIRYMQGICDEDGQPVYRVEMDSEPSERVYCATVLRKVED